MRRIGLLLITGPALLAAACGSGTSQSGTASGAAGSAGACGGAGAGSVTASTASYVMTMVVGEPETMYSQADANAQHPTTGEVMLRGQMVMPGSSTSGSMSMSGTDTGGMNHGGSSSGSAAGSVKHLEIHICTKSGTVVTDASPTISLTDTTGGSSTDVPVAVMQGVASGPDDIHYGNNIALAPGHAYSVDVRLTGEKASFQVPAA